MAILQYTHTPRHFLCFYAHALVKDASLVTYYIRLSNRICSHYLSVYKTLP